ETAPPALALHLDPLADVADERCHWPAVIFKEAKHTHTEVVKHAAVGVRLPAELALDGPDVDAAQLQRREEAGKRRGGSDGHRHGGQPDVDAVRAVDPFGSPTHH